ncbi:hypothetical protein [Comamonas aquatica]|uniref:hypothetical protein n=1 Tax=Comamonas aquatica TaxID=225991 RepID=UPI0034D62F89
MNVLDHMTQDEATVLAAVLLDGGKDQELMDAFADYDFATPWVGGQAWLMERMYTKGQEINVITLYECDVEEFGEADACPIELLNAICQYIQPREKAMAILRATKP